MKTIKKEHTFKFTVCRISYSHREIEVKAASIEEAEELAIDEAGDYEYTEHDVEYKIV